MKTNRVCTRREILKGGLKFKEGVIKMRYSQHALERLEEREEGVFKVYPEVVNVSHDNIYFGYTTNDKHLYKIGLRLKYKHDQWMILIYLPFQDNLVKTVYFKDKHAKKKMYDLREECRE